MPVSGWFATAFAQAIRRPAVVRRNDFSPSTAEFLPWPF